MTGMKKMIHLQTLLLVITMIMASFNSSAQGLQMVDNFNYTVGTTLTTNGWTAHSGAGTNAITVTAPTISYPGYASSGIGNEVTLTTSGEDVNKTFASQTSGAVYAAFLVNVTAAQTAGDYFFHFGASVISTGFQGRIFVKKDPATNNFAFGISKVGAVATAIFTPYSYVIGTTYLVVLKYSIITGASNDVAALYINPTLNTTEPVTGWITSTDVGTDLANIGSVALRQGTAASAPSIKLDGLRVTNTWADATLLAAPTISSFTPTTSGSGTTVTITGTNLSGTSAVSIGGTSASLVTVVDANTVTALVGSGSTGTISLTTSGGTANSAGTFTFIPAPTISSFTPTNGCTGTTVILTGTGFTGATAVSFGGTAATSFTVNSDTQISAVYGNGTTGKIAVTTAGGMVNSNIPFSEGSTATYAYIANSSSNTVSVINTATNAVTATIAVGANPNGVSVSPDGSKVYVANKTGNSLTVLNTATNGVTATVTVESNPYGISVSPDGSKVYVANEGSNSVSVINTVTNSVIANVAVGTAPYGISVSPDGSKVYVANKVSNNVSVINTTTNSVTATVAVGSFPYGISVSPDGSKVYVANKLSNNSVSVINTATNVVAATVTVGINPEGISVSPDGSKVYVVNTGENSVSVINTASNTVTATVAVSSYPEGISVSPDGSKVYVANTNDNSVSVINTVTNAVTATVVVGSHPYSLGNFIANVVLPCNPTPTPTITGFTPTNGCTGTTVTITGTNFTDVTAVSFGGTSATSFIVVNPTTITAVYGSGTTGTISLTTAVGNISSNDNFTEGGGFGITYAYIANYGSNTVSVINTTNNTVTATIPVGAYPYGVSLSPDGSKVYVANSGSNNVSFINTATNTVIATVAVGTNPSIVCFSPDGSKIYVANSGSNSISVINAATISVTATITVGFSPSGISFSPDGSKIYVTRGSTLGVINAATNTLTATVTVGSDAHGVIVSPDGSKVYVANANDNTVSVINTATNIVTNTLTVGQTPFVVSISPDGSKVYVANFNSNTVSVINTATNIITATVTVGTNPYGISISPNGTKVYVTNSGSNTVSVINTSTNTVTATVPVDSSPISVGNFVGNVVFPCIPAPTITGFTPNSGASGATTTITISGTNLIGTSAVSIGGIAASSFTVVSATSVTAVVGSMGTIILTTPSGMAVSSGKFTFADKIITDMMAGTLGTLLIPEELLTINKLTLTGTIDARDFELMRDYMPLLAVLDISGTTISAYTGSLGTSAGTSFYPADELPQNAFYFSTNNTAKVSLTTIVMPTSIASIGNYAFGYCSGLKGNLTIPNSVKTIGEHAFAFCSGFTGSLTIPNSMLNIGDYAFFVCSGLTGSLTIPNSVTNIGVSAFYACSGLKGNLTIGSSVATIGGGAFSDCSGLTGSLTIPNSVTSIWRYAFNGCIGLTGNLTISNSMTTIEDYTFWDCSGLKGSLTIGSAVTTIGECAFGRCSGLTGSLTIPNSVTTIGAGAFEDCGNLTGSLNIPNSVKTIGVAAFSFCTGLTGSLIIPNSVTTIDGNAFSYCRGLVSLTIPNSVTTIGGGAFDECSSLQSIYAHPAKPVDLTASANVFNAVNKTTCKLHVPSGSGSLYAAANQWMDFTSISEGFIAPTVTTEAVSTITTTTATGNGTLTNLGDVNPTQYGVVWSTTTNPDITLSTKTTQGATSTTGAFTSSITGLAPNTQYYVKAYATNSVGINYGNELTFTTSTDPNVNIPKASNITISFTGSGASNSVGDVLVQNLTQGTSVIVPSGNTLYLYDVPTHINQQDEFKDGITIYQNTQQGNNIVSFFSQQAGMAQINAFGLDGRMIVGINQNLQVGENSYEVTLPKGAYVIKVAGNGYGYSAKLINPYNTQGGSNISYFGTKKPIENGFQKSKSGVSVTSMFYIGGDQLIYTAVSGNYSTVLTDVPNVDKTTNFEFVACQDADGKNYKTVTIGTQTWMAENLKTTKYRTNESVPNVTDNTAWAALSTGAWSDYSNLSAVGAKYGHLYNWYAATDSRNIAPMGWHIPSYNEWLKLANYLGGETLAGSSLKESGNSNWAVPNSDATNTSGFSALPGGYRYYNSAFNGIGINGQIFYGFYGYWWTVTESNSTNAWSMLMSSSGGSSLSRDNSKICGFSIRCIKDTASLPTLTTTNVTSLSFSTASSGGNISSDGGAAVTERGIVWSTTSTPIIGGSGVFKAMNGASGIGSFVSTMDALVFGQNYYVRAYATNSMGTAYGNEVTYTIPMPSLPVISTVNVTSITNNSASSGGNVVSDGFPVMGRGICWSTSPSPTIYGSYTSDGASLGVYSSSLTGLTASTTYYVRAYVVSDISGYGFNNPADVTYGNEVSFSTPAAVVTDPDITDADGNVYHSVTIGTQTWLVENMKTTHYRNGDAIANVTDGTSWLSTYTGAWCDYSNNAMIGLQFGHLYNWFAVSDARNIAPVGYHVATDAEWTTLTDYLGGEATAGAKLKQTGTSIWSSPNLGATNETGFTALPGGLRYIDASFNYVTAAGAWWTASQVDISTAMYRGMDYYNAAVARSANAKIGGASVRCVKD